MSDKSYLFDDLVSNAKTVFLKRLYLTGCASFDLRDVNFEDTVMVYDMTVNKIEGIAEQNLIRMVFMSDKVNDKITEKYDELRKETRERLLSAGFNEVPGPFDFDIYALVMSAIDRNELAFRRNLQLARDIENGDK